MAEQAKAQGTITIRRLRSGSTIATVLTTNKTLCQFIGVDGGAIIPDWTVGDNQPTITPLVYLTTGENTAITLSDHNWLYNGTSISFDVSTGIESVNGRFKIDAATGALTIIKNLASATNTSPDILEYRGNAKIDKGIYSVRATISIDIRETASSAYIGYIDANPSTALGTLDADGETIVTQTVLTATLVSAANGEAINSSGYSVKWYKYGSSAVIGTDRQLIVTRNDVDGHQLFVAEFFIESESQYKSNIDIIDIGDEYTVSIAATSTEVSPEQSATLTASLYCNGQLTTASSWEMQGYDRNDLSELSAIHSNSNTLTITNALLSQSGVEYELDIIATATI